MAWRWLLRPACWLRGHRWDTCRTLWGSVLACRRCGLIVGTPQR